MSWLRSFCLSIIAVVCLQAQAESTHSAQGGAPTPLEDSIQRALIHVEEELEMTALEKAKSKVKFLIQESLR